MRRRTTTRRRAPGQSCCPPPAADPPPPTHTQPAADCNHCLRRVHCLTATPASLHMRQRSPAGSVCLTRLRPSLTPCRRKRKAAEATEHTATSAGPNSMSVSPPATDDDDQPGEHPPPPQKTHTPSTTRQTPPHKPHPTNPTPQTRPHKPHPTNPWGRRLWWLGMIWHMIWGGGGWRQLAHCNQQLLRTPQATTLHSRRSEASPPAVAPPPAAVISRAAAAAMPPVGGGGGRAAAGTRVQLPALPALPDLAAPFQELGCA